MAQTLGFCRANLPHSILWRAHKLCYRAVGTAALPQPTSSKKAPTGDQLWASSHPSLELTHQVSSLGYALAGISATSYKLSPTDIASTVKYLTHKQYEHLRSVVPYLEGIDKERAHWYLIWTNKLAACMEPMLTHSSMDALVQLIDEKATEYTPYEAAEVLRSLVYIGYDTTTPVFHKLFSHTKANIDVMDIKSLVLVSSIIHDVVDYDMIRKIINRCQVLFETDAIPRNDATLNAFSALIKILRFYLSYSAQEKIYKYLLDFIHNVPFNSHSMETYVTVISAACILTQYGQNPTQKQIIDAGKQHLPERINSFQPIHLEKVSSVLRLVHQYDDTTRRLIDTRAQTLVNQGNLCFSDVFELFCSLSKRSDPSLVKTLEDLVENIVRNCESEIDKVLVWKLAMALHNVDSKNINLVTFVQSKVADCIIGEPWIPFLTQKEFVNPKHKETLIDSLFTNIAVHSGYSNKLTCIYILAFMLPLRPELHLKLMELIETWNSEELSRFLQGLMEWQWQEKRVRHRKPLTRSNPKVRTVISAVCEQIVNKLDVSNPMTLYTTIKSLSSLSVKSHTSENYLQILMDRFWNNARQTLLSTSPFTLRYILSFCNGSRYFDPHLCDLLSKSVVQADELEYALYIRLFDYLGYCGHAPENMDELMPKALWLLEELDKTGSMLQYLRTIVNLVTIKRVPDDLLASVFTKEFLQRLHMYLQNNPERRQGTYLYLVFLNQCAVIDFPHLEVPWFLNEVGRKCGLKIDALNYHMSVIEDVVGGPQFYKRLSMTPFCHQIPFELATDDVGDILPWNEAQQRKDVKKVAVMVENINSFCLVPKGAPPRMAAKRKCEINHIQKLGYNVVLVPYYEWKGRTRLQYAEYLQQKLGSSAAFPQDVMLKS